MNRVSNTIHWLAVFDHAVPCAGQFALAIPFTSMAASFSATLLTFFRKVLICVMTCNDY